ncbi:Cleavage induced protein [Phytophthora megakarya]|uniref:Cleavage induced protein n=1 Tax=Phytophthora megakarya TaxID=4795 RepID=A0A225W2X9_9STRA|nr:Cleavage induced protein [Phytophthora megakarya]
MHSTICPFLSACCIINAAGASTWRKIKRHKPAYHIHMDASVKGLCALFPTKKQYLQVRFTSSELSLIQRYHGAGGRSFGINGIENDHTMMSTHM